MNTAVNIRRSKLLLVDDDQEFLEVYLELLGKMPSKPEIHTASNGARALALLESEEFSVVLVDLRMPKMDGLQVLSIIRRKHPQVRIVALTGVEDEQFRLRAYSIGVDQYWLKPHSDKEIRHFLDSVESLICQGPAAGFRGVQSKSLMDILQLESLTQGSGVLTITNGQLFARIWMLNGALIDAEAQELRGEEALRRILSWKGGGFEMLPPDPNRPRTIQSSCQALLLEIAQNLDESHAPTGAPDAPTHDTPASKLGTLAMYPGVQFVHSAGTSHPPEIDTWGLDNAEAVTEWSQNRCMISMSLEINSPAAMPQIFWDAVYPVTS